MDMTNYMEENLDMSLRKVLPIMQESITKRTTYFGIKTLKSPIDAWIYQEIIFEIKPDVIVEIGNANGGSALFLAHLCDIIGKGRIIGLDLSNKNLPEYITAHPRITFIEGDACQSFEYVDRLISKDERVLVIEDSAHTYDNTLNVLRLYSKLIKLGDYFIVEDSICHHGLTIGPKPGPYEAIEDFIKENADFEIDRSRERFLITWNPKGYLRRTTLNTTHSYIKQSKKVTLWSVWQILKLFIPPILILVIKRLANRR
jgi:cephalosporin hydroxylase